MRMIVFFDLPVQTKTERRHATAFRNFLLKDGYHMLQFSVYAKQKAHRTAIRCAFCIAYYTIPRAIRER